MRKTVLLLAIAPLAAALLVAGCGESITCPTAPDDECRGTEKADQITGTSGADTIYALAGDDSVQGGEGLGQRLQPLHLPPPGLDVVVEAISRAVRLPEASSGCTLGHGAMTLSKAASAPTP